MPVLPITAAQVAVHVRQKFADRERGALLFEDTPADGVVLAVFGNDGYQLDKRVNREVELMRQWLTAAGAREQGFGVSPDGHSWVLLMRVGNPGYRTPVGRAFYAEMARVEVEEELRLAWREACTGEPAADPGKQERTGRRAG
jgi:hypothetical protein